MFAERDDDVGDMTQEGRDENEALVDCVARPAVDAAGCGGEKTGQDEGRVGVRGVVGRRGIEGEEEREAKTGECGDVAGGRQRRQGIGRKRGRERVGNDKDTRI